MKTIFRAALPALAVAVAAGAQAQGLRGLQFGVGAGLFVPRSERVKNLFSDSIVQYSFGPMSPNRLGRAGFGWDFTGTAISAKGNNMFNLGVMYGFEWQNRGNDEESTMTYARIGAGPAFLAYNVTGPGIDVNRQRATFLTAAEVGVVFNRTLTVSLQYVQLPTYDTLDFSGFRLNAQVTVGRF
jgi:hypothetical protein